MIPEVLLPAWDAFGDFWGWIFGGLGSLVAGGSVFGWLRWRSRNHPHSTDGETTDLSVVRSIVGPVAHEIGTAISEQIKYWRLKNLINISEKFDRICEKKNLTPADLRPLSIAVGVPLLEKASNEEEDELQEMWANLMVSSTSESDQGEESGDIYRIYTNALAGMSKSDCRLLSTVIENGIAGRHEEAIRSNPLTHDEVRQMAGMPRVTADICLENLVSLGLVYRDLRIPIQSGGPTGIDYAYAPTLLGMNLYVVCGNTPKWMDDTGPEAVE